MICRILAACFLLSPLHAGAFCFCDNLDSRPSLSGCNLKSGEMLELDCNHINATSIILPDNICNSSKTKHCIAVSTDPLSPSASRSESIYQRENCLTTIDENLAAFPALRYADFDSNCIGAIKNSAFSNSGMLEMLILSKNNLTELKLDKFPEQNHLRLINLSGNENLHKFPDFNPTKFKHLAFVNINGTGITQINHSALTLPGLMVFLGGNTVELTGEKDGDTPDIICIDQYCSIAEISSGDGSGDGVGYDDDGGGDEGEGAEITGYISNSETNGTTIFTGCNAIAVVKNKEEFAQDALRQCPKLLSYIKDEPKSLFAQEDDVITPTLNSEQTLAIGFGIVIVGIGIIAGISVCAYRSRRSSVSIETGEAPVLESHNPIYTKPSP